MNAMLRVRKEYGEPFVDVVKGFADQGNSQSLTAATLGISLSHFRDLCARLDLLRHFKKGKGLKKECRGGGASDTRGIPRLRRRAPILHDGIVWYPGEATHHYLHEQYRRARGRA